MDRRFVAGIIIVLVILGGLGWYLLARNAGTTNSTQSSTSQQTSTMPSTNMSTAPSSANQNPQITDAVSIKDMAFMPASITVKKGTTVTWTNNDAIAHTVTETDGQTGPDSAAINSGATYTFTFTTAGTYHYHCSIHPSMTGTVTVTES